jgi:hypothetical protein
VAGLLPARAATAPPEAVPQAPPADAAPWSPETLASARSRRASRLNGALAALLAVLILVALPWWRPADPLTGRAGLLSFAPSALAAETRARAAPGTRVVVPQTWASWFEWAVPEPRYFVDSRFELYPAEIWADEAALGAGGDEAAAVLDEWAVDVVVVEAAAPRPSGPWTTAWEDAAGAILVRER